MKRILVLIVAMVLGVVAMGQSSSDCPGFRNPTSFSTGDPQFIWSARVGDRTYTPGNQSDTTTGYHIMSTCTTAPDIIGHGNITSSVYYSGGSDDCNYTFFDANDHRFQIITAANAGIDQYTVSTPGSGMQRIPQGYTSSIRLGDMRCTGQAVTTSSGGIGNNKGSEALFYTMFVTPFNALLIINYAVVARRFDHSAYDAGEFMIRVVKQDTNGTWPNAPVNDSLWYKVSAPHHTGTVAAPWVVGLQTGAWPCMYVYKPWARVAISLSDYIYENVRIEMYTSDCIYNADPLYAYICGDFQSMALLTTGCPDPESEVVDTITAPEGMMSYTWYVANEGAVQNLYDQNAIAATTFRMVQVTSDNNTYTPRVEDFVLAGGPNAGDTATVQTYRCVMVSAMDPAKPMQSRVYVNVTNRRPMIDYEWHCDCDGTVTFENFSYTRLSAGLDPNATYWVVYADTLCTLPLDTLRGESVSYTFPRAGRYGVKLYCETASDGNSASCGAAKSFVCAALGIPPARFTVNNHILCEGSTAVFTCTEGRELQKVWTVDDSVFASTEDDLIETLVMQLAKGVHVVTLKTVNEAGCENTTSDTVIVYGVPEINLGSDRHEICLGDTVQVSASGNGDEYIWNSSPVDTALASQQGQSTIVVSPRQTTTYYLLPSGGNPCSDVGATFSITVLPSPEAEMHASLPSVSVDAKAVSFTDATRNRYTTYWRFSDGVQDSGITVRHVFDIGDEDSVGVWMESCNRAGCCGDTSLWLPVVPTGVWFPNAFIPGDGDRFGMVTAINITGFEIHIYNREGMLVHRGDDLAQPWDGTDLNGQPCHQGAYVYWYRYATNDLGGWHEGHGTVTLLR